MPPIDPQTVARIRGRDGEWVELANAVGLRVERGPAGYVWYDGNGGLGIADESELDPDDTFAQIILHELCHALTEGPAAWHQPDWGLWNEDDRHVWREHAALRLQAAILNAAGLRTTLQPTTDFRAYYLALPDDPLQTDQVAEAETVSVACRAWEGWLTWEHRPAVEAALARLHLAR